MTINAKPISSNTAICPDCGKPHRIRRVSAGRYIKGCAPPCCVYWVEEGEIETMKKITGDKGLAEFQLTRGNCKDCYFANKKKVGTGVPCCTFPGQLKTDGKTCESMRY